MVIKTSRAHYTCPEQTVVGASGGSRRCTQKFVDSNKKSNLEQIDGIPVLLLVRDVQSTVFPSLMSSETLNCAELHFAVRHWARKLWKKKERKKSALEFFKGKEKNQEGRKRRQGKGKRGKRQTKLVGGLTSSFEEIL